MRYDKATIDWLEKLRAQARKGGVIVVDAVKSLKPGPKCKYRRLALEMEKLGAGKLYLPAVAMSHHRRKQDALTRRSLRRKRRATVRRRHGRTRTGLQYRPPQFP